MKKIIKLLFILGALIFSSVAYAISPVLFVFHINGVNTSRIDARKNLDDLIEVAQIKSNMLKWDILYNPTHGLLTSDLWDVFKQKKQEAKHLTIDDYVLIYMKSYHLNHPINSPSYEKLKNGIKQYYLDDPSFVGKNLPDIKYQFDDKILPYQSVLKLLREYKDSKAYVLLLPHSQGNLYANQLCDLLVNGEHFPANHLAIYGIASPTDKILGSVNSAVNDAKYITASNDFVINSLRYFSIFLPATNSPLASNVTLKNCNHTLCHNLIDYLQDEDAKNQIAMSISNYLISLKTNLIEEGKNKNIRAMLKFFLYPDGKHSNGEMVSSENQAICTIEAGTVSCDQKNLSFLEVENDYYKSDVDPFRGYFIGFKDQFKAGDYVVLADFSDPVDAFSMSVLGNIKSAKFSKVDDDCQWARLEDNPLMRMGSEAGSFSDLVFTYYGANYSSYRCINKLPQINYHHKLYVGKITFY